MPTDRCICGKRLGKLKNGNVAKTCNTNTRASCAGRISNAERKHKIVIPPRSYYTYEEHHKGG